MRAPFILVFIAPFALACSTSSGSSSQADASVPACALGFLGDPAKGVELKVVARDGTMSTEIAAGARVPLILPPQGGRVIFIGVVATNISPCSIKLTGSFRDKTNQQVRVDARTVNLQPRGDGWGESTDGDIATFSNVPMCPNQWASTDIYENPFTLTITATDPSGRTGTKTFDVTPYCAEPQYAAECACECKKGYMLGQTCM